VTGSTLKPRLARLARRSPLAIGTAVAHVLAREVECRRLERRLAAAATNGGTVVVGPFVGEVGFELLYWIPFVRRLLDGHGIPRERVVALARGGAGCWYGDIAASSVEILDLMQPETFHARLREERARAGHSRQLSVTSLDRALLTELRRELEPAALVHPLLAYMRLRHVWDGLEPVSALSARTSYRGLEPPAGVELPATLPTSYVAVKPYFSTCFPDTELNRRFLREVVTGLARTTDVVVMSTGLDVDDHPEWLERPDAHVHTLAGRLDARDNLAVQTAVVAHASALVTTYGGFSYLGPLVGVPTLAYHSLANFNPVHLEALRGLVRPRSFHVLHAAGRTAVDEALSSPILPAHPLVRSQS